MAQQRDNLGQVFHCQFHGIDQLVYTPNGKRVRGQLEHSSERRPNAEECELLASDPSFIATSNVTEDSLDILPMQFRTTRFAVRAEKINSLAPSSAWPIEESLSSPFMNETLNTE